MRIISQDRNVDIPYDNAIIKINDADQIIALIGERFVCLGSYELPPPTISEMVSTIPCGIVRHVHSATTPFGKPIRHT